MKWGYDYIEIETDDIILFLKEARKNHLIILNLKQSHNNVYYFYTPIYQRLKVKRLGLTIKKSVGIFAYILQLFHFKHFVFTFSFLLALLFYCRLIYGVEVSGSNQRINKQLELYLQRNMDIIQPKMSYQEINDLYEDIKNEFVGQIDYLNIYQNGGIIHIKYTGAVVNQTKKIGFQNYVAKKDGVICFIDVKKGNVVVRQNQFVKKGELLISNSLEDTSQKTKIIATEGKIYAYTYQRYQSSMDGANLSKDECFDRLLFAIRSKLPANTKIDKEKVVSYDIIDNKLVLEMQYVFIENIAVKEK